MLKELFFVLGNNGENVKCVILTNGHYAQKEENVTHSLDIFHVTTSGCWIAGGKKAADSLTNHKGGISLICLRDLSLFRNLKLEDTQSLL